MIKQWLLSVFGPESRFNVGDSVQPVNGDDELMVVKKIIRKWETKEPLILCQGYDEEKKKRKEALYPEKELKPFDWYRPRKTK